MLTMNQAEPKDLIIFRAGLNSLHHLWQSSHPSYDIFICPYIDVSDQKNFEGLYQSSVLAGAKWTGLSQLLKEWNDWRNYRYIMLADDDLFMPYLTIPHYFNLCSQLNAKLCQPSLTVESQISHEIVLKNTQFIARATTFVEIMAPCFRADVLSDLLWTLELTKTGWGWGLDHLWPKLLNYEGLYVIDAYPMVHTMPVGRSRNLEIKKRVIKEHNDIIARYKIQRNFRTLSGICSNGMIISDSDPSLTSKLIRGYDALIQQDPKFLFRLLRDQHGRAQSTVKENNLSAKPSST